MEVNPLFRNRSQSEEENSVGAEIPNGLRDALNMYDIGMASYKNKSLENSATRVEGYHSRSTSGTSQFSVATSGSGQRTGSFVHPFQQNPRPFTPPLITNNLDSSRFNELAGINSVADEECDPRLYHYYATPSNSSSFRSNSIALPSTIPQMSQPFTQTKMSTSRLALVSSYSSLSSKCNLNDSSSSSNITRQSSVCAPVEKGFRLRSRSEVISRSRAQSIQEARRKFLEKEMVQEEKAAREEIKQLEKRQQKEAIKIERFNRQSSVCDTSRTKRLKSDATAQETNEVFMDRAEHSSSDEHLYKWEDCPEWRRNSSLAKQKTHSAWAIFLMWFRTRLMRVERRISVNKS